MPAVTAGADTCIARRGRGRTFYYGDAGDDLLIFIAGDIGHDLYGGYAGEADG